MPRATRPSAKPVAAPLAAPPSPPPPRRRRKRVALIIETSNEYARGLLHGIRAYIREHENWDIDLDERRRGEATRWLKDFRGDGVIARIENAAIADEVQASGLPCVDVSAARQVPGIPWVETDDAEIARMAFEHLTERGLRRLAFCGDEHFNWALWRRDAFVKLVERAGLDCAVFPPPHRARHLAHEAELTALSDWVAGLPRPVGVMACYDIRGRQVLAACRALDLAVPDDVAVIGVDNDELLCDLSDPPLSSVAPDTDSTGYLAAQLLDRMMHDREPVPPTAHLVKPLGVVPRLSTDTLAIADPQMAKAVRFIRAHACDGINVADVLRQVSGMSRRVFENEFKKLFGRMPHEEIVRTRVQRVKELLTQTDLPLYTVANRAGFKHVEYMSVVFKKKTGVPPSEYRERKGK
ncbi:MAG TPA: DNA-binding transcriptional regulator [Tepidisphaeraceae bacterium]|jgi:LacI family transcriptional regulator